MTKHLLVQQFSPDSPPLQGQPRTVASPPIETQQLPASLVLLAEILGHAAPHLRESAAHHLAEVALSSSRQSHYQPKLSQTEEGLT